MSAETPATPQKWEFRFITKQTESYLLTELNEVGRAGWDVVSINYAKDLKGIWNWTAFIKRPLSDEAAVTTPDVSDAAAPASSTALREPVVIQGFDLGDDEFKFKE
jgi:hypothetical protein